MGDPRGGRRDGRSRASSGPGMPAGAAHRAWARWVAAVVALLCLGASALEGQETEVEEQVPLLPSLSVVEVDAALRRELGLFAEVEGFDAARLFRSGDGRLILEISRRREGRLVRERRTLGAGAPTRAARAP